MLNGLDLFSGIGGISIALRDWVRPVAYCEIDPYCQAVLLSRMANGDICPAPIWDDVKTLCPKMFRDGQIEIIYGGFPCQNISIAGLGKGLDGEQSRLFFEIVRLSKEIKPKFIFLENVPAITIRGGLQVVREITEMGYDCRWCVISAASIGAFHKRERWFLLAYSTGGIFNGNTNSISSEQTNSLSKPIQEEKSTWGGSSGQYWPFESREHWQEAVSTVCRTSDGVPRQLDRLRALGNAVVPCQARKAFCILSGINTQVDCNQEEV